MFQGLTRTFFSQAPVVDGYGSTECGGVTIDHSINRRTVLDAKLIDVPDLGKSHSDYRITCSIGGGSLHQDE